MTSLREFFSLPMDAGPNSRFTGDIDEFGRPIQQGALGTQYTMRETEPLSFQEEASAFIQGAREQPREAITSVARALAEGAWNGVSAPGRALQGEALTYGDVADTALDWGVMGAFNRAPEGSLRIFAGRNAQTADAGALQRAQDMATSGASRDDIWRDTGWFQGVDGQWRFEIDDSGLGLRDSAVRPVERYSLFGRADRTISHPELAQSYDLPFEYDLGIGSTLRGGSMRGPTYWRSDIPERGIAAGDVQDLGRIRARGVDRPELERTTLHEIQHAVQDVEGFSRGSNVSDEAAAIAARRDRELMQQVESALTPQETADLARYRELSAQYKDAGTIPGDVVIEVNDLRQRLRRVDGLMDEVRVLRQQGQGGALEGGAISREAAYDQYRRVAGEVEARNVEARRDFTPEQRRATPPWQTQDVPDADQIVRYGSGTQASTPETPAQTVSRLLREGRASEVTDDLMAQVDPQEMARLYEGGATGMDMPLDEASRMARAQEMGFDTDVYHGTAGDDFSAFRPGSSPSLPVDGAIWNSTTPDGGANYIAQSRMQSAGQDAGRVVPLRVNTGQNLTVDASGAHAVDVRGIRNAAQEYDAVTLQNVREFGQPELTESVGVFDPRNIRSRFARFDPRLSHLANLSAGIGAGAVMLPMLDERETEMQALRDYVERVQ